MSDVVMRASDFLDTLGVNTHIPYTDGGYANISNVIADMAYLGIDETRDSISNGASGSAPLSSYIQVAQAGVKFTITVNATTTAGLQANLALVEQLNQAVPGSVIAVEGPNEINNFPVTYNGVSGLQGALNLQKALYSMVHSNAALQGVAVDYFTGYGAGSIAQGPDPATTSGLADYDTQHPYPNDGTPPDLSVNPLHTLTNETAGIGPAVFTETGYSTNGGTTGDVNQDVQAKYSLDLLMDDAKNGIAHTDLYQLMDAYQPGSPQGDDGFGLFNPSNQPKEAATAIHDLTTILADTGTNASTFTTTPIAYSVTGLPTTGSSMLIQKSNGASDIVVWNEPAIWNESTGTETTAATQNVTVQLGATYQKVEVFDPLSSATPIKTLTNVSSVALGLTDHPLIVEVEPQTTTTPPPPPPPPPPTTDTLTLRMSEDAYQGNADFTVDVNGTQVGGTYATSALHSAGDSQVFSLTGDWNSGVNDVEINFINDDYGGTASTDRNLYVNSIAYNGVTDAGTSATMLSNGSTDFTVGGSTPTASAPADKVTLNLSEDAYDGNAQFVLYIDGKPVTAPAVVSALADAKQAQGFTFTGNWGAGTHTIGVAFVNDAYGGTPTTDRNLYVDSVAVNNTIVSTGINELYSNGTDTFTVTTTH
jgi:hypothetical protein